MTKKLCISIVLLCALLLGAYLLYGDVQSKNTQSTTEVTGANVVVQPTNTEPTPKNEVEKIPDDKVDVTNTTMPDIEGIHIMPDGTVMAKDGSEVKGAEILENGMIKLQDGQLVKPLVDMRVGTKSTTEASKIKNAQVNIDVVGTDFAYDIKQIKVKKGDTVTINFKSEEGFHDWALDEFKAFTKRVNQGEGTTSVTFVAEKVGTFQYYCSVMSHRQQGMVGYLVVSER